MNARCGRLLSHLCCLSSIFICGAKVSEASVPAVVADGQIALASGLSYPQGVAVSSTGTIYVADTGNNRIVTISNTGVVTPVSIPGFTLSAPEAVAVDAAGNLYIADFNNGRILEVPAGGSPTVVPGSTTVSSPISIAVDSAHSIIYVGDQNTAGVYKLAGGVATELAITNAINLFPQALAVDGSGDLYLADDNSNNIYELAYGATSAQNVTPNGFTLSSPSGMAFDATGSLFVLDTFNTRIIEVPQTNPAQPYQVPITGLNTASSLALDPSGNLYVTDVGNNNLTQLIYSGNAVNLGAVAVGGAGPSVAFNYELNAPETLTAFKVTMRGDPGQEASVGAGTTCQFQSYTDNPSPGGNPISALNPFVCMANIQGAPAYPGIRGGAVNLLGPSSSLLVSVPFTETGTAASAWIAPGTANLVVTGFSTPQGVAVSGQNGTIYIADASAGKVYISNGVTGTASTLPTVSTAPVTLQSPEDVAIDGAGDLFISDFGPDPPAAAGKIVVVPANKAIAPYVLATGSVLEHPLSLAFDANGDLYISDAGPLGSNATSAQPGFVVKMPPAGGPISKLNTTAANLVYPANLVEDSAGNLYIDDEGDVSASQGQVLVVPANGSTASVVNIPGLLLPQGIAVDPAGQLWVLDGFNLNQFTIVPPNGGSPYAVPLVGTPTLGNPSKMVFTAGSNNLLLTDLIGTLAQVSGLQARLNFPTTAVTTPPTPSPSQPAYIVSTGNAPLKPSTSSNAYYETGNVSDFQVQSAAICSGITQLQPAQYCTLPAAFAPAYEGVQLSLLTSIFNSANQVQLLLTGTTPNASSATASPAFSAASGTFSTSQVIAISDATPGAVIYYTVDGSTPTTSSPVYHNPVTVTVTTTVNAIAIASGLTASPVATATYTFNPYLGDNDYSDDISDYANFINATYAVTGNDSGGYTVTSCSFYQPGGTVTAGANMDCGLILAPTPTTKSSSWLCHATYTNPGPSGAGAWITVALSGCGTLPHGTPYWVATDSNDPIPAFPYGFSTCGGTCNGPAPTVGNGTYPCYYSQATYHQYTGLSSGMAVNAGLQASQFVTLGLNTPLQTASPTLSVATGTYSTAQAVTVSDATSGAVLYYTTDGSTPTTSSAVYHSAITVTNTTTVNVLAVAPGYTNSAVATATYTFNPYLGTNAYSTLGFDNANYINATYAVTGSNTHGYTVSSCSFFQPTGTVTSGKKVDCGLVLAPTPTTQSSSWLCHGTYTNPSSHGAGAWITVSLSGCGTLPASTAYWVATDSNDTHSDFPYGFWSCGGSCNGSAPTVGTGTYGYRYIAATYGQYTGMGTAMLAAANEQASQYVSLTAVP